LEQDEQSAGCKASGINARASRMAGRIFLCGVNTFLTSAIALLITCFTRKWRISFRQYERSHLPGRDRRLLRRERAVCPALRKTLGDPMEYIVVGIVALLLFVYLFVAMVRPEWF
jgi:K+-transporting ATPase KdpF subunit